MVRLRPTPERPDEGPGATAAGEPRKKRGGCLKPLLLGLGGLILIGIIATAVGGDEEPTAGGPAATSTAAERTTEESSAPEETTEAEEPTEEPSPEPTTEEAEPEDDMTDSQRNAVRAAENYLASIPFSRQGLIDQLSSEFGDQYTVEQATNGVEQIEDDVDWNEQAARAAENYLDSMPFSRQELIDQLSSEFGDKYTVEQATYGVDQAGL